MGVNWEEQERVRQLLTEAITVLCKNGLQYSNKFNIEGLLGITLDDNDILLINIKETIKTGMAGDSMVAMPQQKMTQMPNRPATGFSGRGFSSLRRGRARGVVAARGRTPILGNRKRPFGSYPVRPVQPEMRSPQQQQQQMSMPQPDQSGLSEGPLPKMKHEEHPSDVIEIGDEDDGGPEAVQNFPTQVKQEAPDLPSSSTDPQSGQDTKFSLDGESNKSLTDFLDNLMTQHDVGPGSGGNPTPSGTPLSGMAQMKAEPASIAWDQQGAPSESYQSPPPQSFASPQSQVSAWNLSTRSVPRGLDRRKNTSPKKATSSSHVKDLKDYVSLTFHCARCNRTFANRTALQKHIFSKHEDSSSKPEKCHLCPKAFISKSSLLRHIKAHQGIYSYTCSFCSRGFSTKEHLAGHEAKSHTGAELFKCDVCLRSFSYKCDLVKHKKAFHSNC